MEYTTCSDETRDTCLFLSISEQSQSDTIHGLCLTYCGSFILARVASIQIDPEQNPGLGQFNVCQLG